MRHSILLTALPLFLGMDLLLPFLLAWLIRATAIPCRL